MDSLKKELRKTIFKQRENFKLSAYIEQNTAINNRIKILLDYLIDSANTGNKIKNNNPHSGIFASNPGKKNFTIGLYWPLTGEPDLFPLSANSLIVSKNQATALPKVGKQTMKYILYHPDSLLEKSKFHGLIQPLDDIETVPEIMLIPGLAFSKDGYRLGFGLGYYDRYCLETEKLYPVTKIGVCFHNNLLDSLPNNQDDIKLDYIVTDKISIKL